ncbi:OsmC family protein [Irregularibacter muris]|uniref:OsmC family protein n=1 Tax=Irregularibacter muris TaxID=1796619 RepID=A0AAE3HEC0_9FIRM|nr:OsmC family protein [Irregularibacter muris]MCR1898571.1 OsmC family protein [Irregularibacter muris]
MGVHTLKAKVKRVSGLEVEGESRGFKVIMDEPIDEGGTDKGMNPMEMILCGLGGCQTIVASAFAESQGIDLQDFWVEIEGDLDVEGFMGLSDVRPGYQEIRYTMHIKSSSPEDKVREFAKFIDSRCPVGDSLKNTVNFVETDVIISK